MPLQILQKLRSDIKDVMSEIIALYDIEVDRVIQSLNEFAELGFTEQDIVDSARLLNSKKLDTIEDQGSTVTRTTFTWDPISPENGFPYAPAVWAGFFAWGRKFIPGRKWDLRAAKNTAIALEFVSRMRKRGWDAQLIFENISTLP